MVNKKRLDFDPSIDRNRLDDEWCGQSSLYHQWATEAAEARKNFDGAKAQLELVDAELATAIRKDPKSYDLEKTTNDIVGAAIVQQQEHREAAQAVIDAKYEYDMAQVAVDTLDHRRSALSRLVDLFLADYYSKPRAKTPDAKEKMDEVERRSVRRGRKRRE